MSAMSVIDEVIAANEIYSRTHELRKLTPRPERKLAVLTCMDTRLSIRTLGLKTGDAHILRNAGGIVTEDACDPWSFRTICWAPRRSWSSITPIAA